MADLGGGSGWFTANPPPSTPAVVPTSTNGTPVTFSPTGGLDKSPFIPTNNGTGSPSWTGSVYGGGWSQFATQPGTPQYALAQVFQQGLTGQAAVTAANQLLGLTPPNSISFSNGTYGLPNGYYAAPNPSNPNAIDLIQRSGGDGSGAGNGTNYNSSFTLPTAADVANTPGYQFALQQGEQAVQRSAAAQGDLLTGGTLKAEDQYAQGLASQTYQNAVTNSLNAFDTNFGVFNTGNQFLLNQQQLGLTGANAATS